jgi:hypothetical protein
MEWVLIIYIYAGPWSKTDSVTITSVPMATEQICHQSAKDAEPLVSKTSFKEIRTVCLRVKQ